MTTTEHPQEQQLTRRQLRELQLSGDASATEDAAPASATTVAAPPVSPTLPHAVDTFVPPAPTLPVEAESADSAEPRLTRREIREMERVRTASVPVYTEQPAAVSEAAAAPEVAAHRDDVLPEIPLLAEPIIPAAQTYVAPTPPTVADPAPTFAEPVYVEPAVERPAYVDPSYDQAAPVEPVVEPTYPQPDYAAPAADDGSRWPTPAPVVASVDEEPADAPRVAGTFGEVLLDSAASTAVEPEQSFDSLLGRGVDTSGSSTSGHALILNDAALPPLTAPVTSNGETLLTGTFALPESLSSQGHVGAADGKDVDAVLIDGELPAASSPTPIAATAAVSQAKTPGEIIKPPAPEKSNKLMLVLAITAGALAVTLGVVIVVAILNGALA